MKRKLVCIFFMIIGAAVIVGTILLSQGRPEETNASPLFALIILSVVTIITAAANLKGDPDKPEISKSQKVFLWIFRAVNILCLLACLAFIVLMLIPTGKYYAIDLHYVFGLMVLAATGVILAAFCVKERPPIIMRDIVKAVIALVIAPALGFIYLSYMPKYTIEDSVNISRSDTEYAQKDVFYPTYRFPGEPDGIIYRSGGTDPFYDQFFGANPFFYPLFEYYCDSYGYDADGLTIKKGYIISNPVNGAYEYLRTPDQDQTFSPGEWPSFNWSYMHDKDGQHGTVLNLYFRDWRFSEALAKDDNPMFTVRSDEWDAKLQEVMYPHNFSEDEAISFLQSIGEEELKAKLLEQINDLDQVVVFDKKEDGTTGLVVTGTKGKTVEVYFFGIDIATYQNGVIFLNRSVIDNEAMPAIMPIAPPMEDKKTKMLNTVLARVQKNIDTGSFEGFKRGSTFNEVAACGLNLKYATSTFAADFFSFHSKIYYIFEPENGRLQFYLLTDAWAEKDTKTTEILDKLDKELGSHIKNGDTYSWEFGKNSVQLQTRLSEEEGKSTVAIITIGNPDKALSPLDIPGIFYSLFGKKSTAEYENKMFALLLKTWNADVGSHLSYQTDDVSIRFYFILDEKSNSIVLRAGRYDYIAKTLNVDSSVDYMQDCLRDLRKVLGDSSGYKYILPDGSEVETNEEIKQLQIESFRLHTFWPGISISPQYNKDQGVTFQIDFDEGFFYLHI